MLKFKSKTFQSNLSFISSQSCNYVHVVHKHKISDAAEEYVKSAIMADGRRKPMVTAVFYYGWRSQCTVWFQIRGKITT